MQTPSGNSPNQYRCRYKTKQTTRPIRCVLGMYTVERDNCEVTHCNKHNCAQTRKMTHVKSWLTGQTVQRQQKNDYLVKGQTNTRYRVTKKQEERHDELRHTNLAGLMADVITTARHSFRETRNLWLLGGFVQMRVNLRSLAHHRPPRSTRV